MITTLQKILRRLSNTQQKHTFSVLLLILLITFVAFIGITKLTLESDLSTLNPKGLPVTDLDEEIRTNFQQFDGIFVAIELDNQLSQDGIKDIRDPQVIAFLERIETNLEKEPEIQQVTSLAVFFNKDNIPSSLSESQQVLSNIPGAENFVNKDFSLTFVTISATINTQSEEIQAFNDKVRDLIQFSSPPGGVKTVVTGEAPLVAIIFDLLISDAVFTLILASIFIFILLIFIRGSLKESLIVMIPLLFGLSWTLGTMGWIGIPITIGTVAISAMLLGLGTEYAVFLTSRYKEELANHNINEALEISLTQVGASIFSSGGTTTIGFGALATSIFPVLADLGLSLALGIFLLLTSTILVTPIVILLWAKVDNLLGKENKVVKEKKPAKVTKLFRIYGKFASNHPVLLLFLAITITGLMFIGITQIERSDVEFENLLPEDLEEINVFTLVNDEFGETASIIIYTTLDPSLTRSDEPKDIRDHKVLSYIDVLTQKSKTIDHVVSVSSISSVVKSNNIIPKTISSNKEIFNSPQAKRHINDDFSVSLIRIEVEEDAISDRLELVRQVNELVETTEKPPGLISIVTGNLAVFVEQDEFNNKDTQRTSLMSLIGIIIFLFILLRSFKGVFLPLITVILAVIWTLGTIGYSKVPFNNITSSVITMTIGVGIDFGIQLLTRFQYEFKNLDKKKAMENTITHILTPMFITVIAALLGFRAMGFGELNLMKDLGNTMGIAITVSMFAAITGVASLIMLFHRDKKRKSL